MQVFTFTALLLSIFGAGFTAVSSLRHYWADDIKEWRVDLPEWVASIQQSNLIAHNETVCSNGKCFNNCYRLWKVCHWLPIIVFAILVGVVAVYAGFKIPSEGETLIVVEAKLYWWAVGPLFILNAGCFAGAMVSYMGMSAYFSRAKNTHRMFMEGGNGNGGNLGGLTRA